MFSLGNYLSALYLSLDFVTGLDTDIAFGILSAQVKKIGNRIGNDYYLYRLPKVWACLFAIGFQRMWVPCFFFPIDSVPLFEESNRKDLQQPREGDSKEKPWPDPVGRFQVDRQVDRANKKTVRWRSILLISNN